MLFLDLPLEIIAYTLSHVEAEDLVACKLTCAKLNDAVKTFLALQYILGLGVAKAEDDPRSNMSLVDRLRALRESEESWALLEPKFTTSSVLPGSDDDRSGLYDISEGFYIFGNANRTILHVLKLPSKPQEELRWKQILSDNMILDIALCAYEHDLIALVIAYSDFDQPRAINIELDFRQLSTGNPHPEALQHRICVLSETTGRPLPRITIEVAGDIVALLLSFGASENGNVFDHVCVYEWRTGVRKCHIVARQIYSGLIFLKEDLILLPNITANCFDIFQVPVNPASDDLTPILSLSLPKLVEGWELIIVNCWAKPNPIDIRSQKDVKARVDEKSNFEKCSGVTECGFLPNSTDAICIFRMDYFSVVETPGILIENSQSFSVVIHRSAFVLSVERFSTPDFLESMSSSSSTSTTALTVPWSHWGPPVSRWFNNEDISFNWITNSAGQRIVRKGNNIPTRYIVCDFNPNNVRRMKAKSIREKNIDYYNFLDGSSVSHNGGKGRQSEASSSALSTLPLNNEDNEYDDNIVNYSSPSPSPESLILESLENILEPYPHPEVYPPFLCDYTAGLEKRKSLPPISRVTVVTSAETILAGNGSFAEPVEGSLPYVACISEVLYAFSNIALDEHRVLGLVEGYKNHTEIDIHHFG